MKTLTIFRAYSKAHWGWRDSFLNIGCSATNTGIDRMALRLKKRRRQIARFGVVLHERIEKLDKLTEAK